MAAPFMAKLFSGLMHMSPYTRAFMEGFEGRGLAGAQNEEAQAALEEDNRRRAARGSVGTVGGTRGGGGPLAMGPMMPGAGSAQPSGPMAMEAEGPAAAGGPLAQAPQAPSATPGGVALGPLAQAGPQTPQTLGPSPTQSSHRLPTPFEILESAGIPVGYVEPNVPRDQLERAVGVTQAANRASLYRPLGALQMADAAEARDVLRARSRAQQAFMQRYDALSNEFVARTYEDIALKRELANDLRKTGMQVEGKLTKADMDNLSRERRKVLELGARVQEQKLKDLNDLQKENIPDRAKQAKFLATQGQEFAAATHQSAGVAKNLELLLDAAPAVTINTPGRTWGRVLAASGYPVPARANFDTAARALANATLDQVQDSQPALYQVMRQIKSTVNENVQNRDSLFDYLGVQLTDLVNNMASTIDIHERSLDLMGVEPGLETTDARDLLTQFTKMKNYVDYVNSLEDKDTAEPYSFFVQQQQRQRQQRQQQPRQARSSGATGSW